MQDGFASLPHQYNLRLHLFDYCSAESKARGGRVPTPRLYPDPGSNRDGSPQRCLRPSRLPIPPSGHWFCIVRIFFRGGKTARMLFTKKRPKSPGVMCLGGFGRCMSGYSLSGCRPWRRLCRRLCVRSGRTRLLQLAEPLRRHWRRVPLRGPRGRRGSARRRGRVWIPVRLRR